MEWLVISWFLTLGIMPDHSYGMNGQTNWYAYEGSQPTFTQQLGLRFDVAEFFAVYTDIKIYDKSQKDSWTFSPYQSDFYIGAEFYWRGFKLGFKHLCQHPITAWQWQGDQLSDFNGAQTEFYLTFSGRTRLF